MSRPRGTSSARGAGLRRLRGPLVAAVLGGGLLVGGLTLGHGAPVAAAVDLAPPVSSAPAAVPAPAPDPAPAASPLPAPDPVPPALPARVALPRQGAGAPLVAIGLDRRRELDLPRDPRQVGWWSGSALPGSPTGGAVLAGHVDSASAGLGTFAALLDVREGDPVQVTGADGVVHDYVVTSRHTYRKAVLPSAVFRVDGPAGLTLVTCGGPFDEATHHYRDNVVVTAAPA